MTLFHNLIENLGFQFIIAIAIGLIGVAIAFALMLIAKLSLFPTLFTIINGIVACAVQILLYAFAVSGVVDTLYFANGYSLAYQRSDQYIWTWAVGLAVG